MDTMNQMPYPSQNPEQQSVGPMIAAIIVIILLIIGAIYFWNERVDLGNENAAPVATSTPEETTETNALEIQAGLEGSINTQSTTGTSTN
jgi:hypothetical protein